MWKKLKLEFMREKYYMSIPHMKKKLFIIWPFR